MRKNTTWAVMTIITALLFTACHPAKQLQKQDDAIAALKAKWIFEWVKEHPCPPLPAMNLDSLCQLRNGSASDTGFTGDFSLTPRPANDSTPPTRDIAIARKPPPCTPKTILVPYQDTRMLDLLKDSLESAARQIAMLQAGSGVQSQDCSKALAAAQKSTDKWIWLFIAACVLMVLFLILWIRSIL